MSPPRLPLAAALSLSLAPLVAAADYSLTVIEPPKDTVRYSIVGPDAVTSSGFVALDTGFRDPDAPEDVDNRAALWSAADGARRLDTLGGFTAEASDVNESGEVVGRSRNAGAVRHAFLWSASDGIRDLGTLGDSSRATAINEAAEVVGWSSTSEGPRAFFWSATTDIVGLDALGAEEAYALDIDDDGRVTGILESDGNRVTRVFAWTADDGTVDRGTIDGEFATVTDTNDAGTVVGRTRFADGGTHAFAFTADGATIDLGTLGGDSSNARAVSESGEFVVGSSELGDGTEHAFSWSFSGGLRDLGTLGGDASRANDVNDAGTVVGGSRDANGNSRAVVWTEAEGIVDLNERIVPSDPDAPVLDEALAITADGKIVASARSDGARIYVLLTPDSGDGDGDGDGGGDGDDGDSDSDSDGVADADDLCPGTVLGIEPTRRTLKNRFYSDENGDFVDGLGEPSGYTVGDTGGCSGQQIIEAAELGKGHSRYGLSRSVLGSWIGAL